MDRRVERTKRNIYFAFFELLKNKSMDEISITELANKADIDRRTFYMHYDTVIAVYLEFKQQLEDHLLSLPEECDLQNQSSNPTVTELPYPRFDFNHFFEELQAIMTANLEFYEKLSSDRASMFLRYDCKDILEVALN